MNQNTFDFIDTSMLQFSTSKFISFNVNKSKIRIFLDQVIEGIKKPFDEAFSHIRTLKKRKQIHLTHKCLMVET